MVCAVSALVLDQASRLYHLLCIVLELAGEVLATLSSLNDLMSILPNLKARCLCPIPSILPRIATQSQILIGTDSENTIFALFWLEPPSNKGGKFFELPNFGLKS